MSSSLDHKCQRCGSLYNGQTCPFCTIAGLDANTLLPSDGLTMPQTASSVSTSVSEPPDTAESQICLVDVVSSRSFPVNTPVCRFGRDISNDIVLTGDKSLSRFHFQITLLKGDYYVEDSGSRNGTFLNGSPVTAPRKVLNGDIVSAGITRYRFVERFKDLKSATVAEENSKQPNETPVAELFQEQLRAMDAVSCTKSASSGTESEAALTMGATPTDAENTEAPPPIMDIIESPPHPPTIQQALEPEKSSSPAAATERNLQADAPPVEEAWPAWCKDYRLPELESIEARLAVLECEISERQAELKSLSASMSEAELVKNKLLAGQGKQIRSAVIDILNSLGWQTANNGENLNEIIISSEGRPAAILRLVCTDSQPKPNELASLVSSLSTYWSDNGIEPKGILLVAYMTDNVPKDRPSVTDDYAAYAAKKNLCVMSSTQLLAVYRMVKFRKADIESIKVSIFDTSGQLRGFNLDTSASDDEYSQTRP